MAKTDLRASAKRVWSTTTLSIFDDATAAGFRLAEEGSMLARAADTRHFSVTKLRDRGDCFVLKFVKP